MISSEDQNIFDVSGEGKGRQADLSQAKVTVASPVLCSHSFQFPMG